MSNLIGQSIGRYHITEQLGEGGMATVYKAFDTRLEREVAVKVLLQQRQLSEKFLKRFEREAKALAQLSHPNIVKVLDYGEHEGLPYLVMEYVPGGTLKQKLGKPIPPTEASRLLSPIARALEYAHQHKIIHRDIKPANILLTESGQPMLSDFGIAKILQEEETMDLTGTGVGVGTPEYVAPEQGLGLAVDHRADIYALGIVFYELITGRKPFRADTPMAVVIKQINDPLPRPKEFVRGISDTIEQVVFKALAKRPEDRFQDMGAFAAVLEKLAAGRKVSVGKVVRDAQRGPVLIGTSLGSAVLVVGILIVVAIAGVLFWQVNQAQQTQIGIQATAARIAQAVTETARAPTATLKPTSTIDLFVAAIEQIRATTTQRAIEDATRYAQRTLEGATRHAQQTIIALTPSNTPLPTRTPFPTSIPQQLFVAGYIQGTKFVAETDGIYRFTIISGAARQCPASRASENCSKWLAALNIYRNREIAWSTQSNSFGFYDALSSDLTLGNWQYKNTSAEAEAIGVGKSVDIALRRAEFLWLIFPDSKDTYNDNSGGMTLSVTIVGPLP